MSTDAASAGPQDAAPSPLAPWLSSQRDALLAQRGHAWLLQGPSGLGQYRLALELARAWLCENPSGQGACGHCPSCHAIDVRTHADFFVLMPETVMIELGWPLSEKAQDEIDAKSRKPSKEIRIDAMRDAVEFCQRTASRGRGKAVLVYPAERMNQFTANALLKTLEEPPGDLRFVLASEAAHHLLPTIRSRCLIHSMHWPQPEQAMAWLQEEGAGQSRAQGKSGERGGALPASTAAALLRAAGGRPEEALAFARAGHNPQVWAALPKAMARGDTSALSDWTPAQAVDALQKICHDLMALGAGAAPRFFAPSDLPPPAALAALGQWSKDLARSVRTVEHPFNAGLMLEALVSQARHALNSRT
ncbi:MAG: DNA polymerase III subunit delta' [Burkholderiaceae bacterium]|nr:DNA polymerase III subunit delta' [Burkholderiaceae bacterium]MDO9089699.1 DNA polymerase III subunit delta' [Burkholderiaceae bacterium]